MSRKKALKDKHKEMVTKTLAEMKKQSEGDEGLEEKHDQVQEAYKTSEQQLRDDLVRVAYNNPEIREDILPLVADNSKSVYEASSDEDSQLRESLIRVAYENPEIRDDLIPLIKDN